MPTSVHMARPQDDGRHRPGAGALPLWNESFWFPFYDPAAEIGVVLRVGCTPNQGSANLYLFITQGGSIVHSVVDMRAPLPAFEENRLALGGFSMEWEAPLDRFRLRYAHGNHGFDVVWAGYSPTYLYPAPPGTTAEQVTRHIEHAGAVTGTVTIGGRPVS